MYRLMFYLSPLLLLFGCSNEVNGVDKSIHDEAEKYANILINYDQPIGMTNINAIDKFVNDDSYNDKEQDLVDNVAKLFVLNTQGQAQTGLGESTAETDDKIQETVDYLENEYQLNIEND